LFSKSRYFLKMPGNGSKAPELEDVIKKEKEVIKFIIDKLGDAFSLERFKMGYSYYSKDLCEVTESGFIDYLCVFFGDKGSPHLGDLIKWGIKDVVPYDIVRDFKTILNKPLYNELVENAFYHAPPYLQLYGYMSQIKRWPMLSLTVMEWDNPEIVSGFKDYVEQFYPKLNSRGLINQVDSWPFYLQ